VLSVKVVFYTSGTTGSGRMVRGIAVGNAIARRGLACDYTIVHSSPFAHLADVLGQQHFEIPPEHEDGLRPDTFPDSILYKTLGTLKPDILIVDLLWFTLDSFIRDLPCKKIFLCHYVVDSFFAAPLEDRTIYFRPEDYDRLLAIEPFRNNIPFDEINPIVIRNRDEIVSRERACARLELDVNGKHCLYAFNGNPGDFEKNKKTYSHLGDEGYSMVYTTNYQGGLFPVVDYFNAFDLVICAAGYNQFWETIYFSKKALYETIQGNFSSQEKRIKMGRRFKFDVNGADQLVDIIAKL
jgi:hypothetical protein